MASPAPTAPRTRRSRLRLVAFAVLGVAVGALTLSGCVRSRTSHAQQEGLIGSIDVVVTGCGSKANTQGCGLGNSGLESNATGTGQVLLGLQVDSRYVPPATFKTNPGRQSALHGEPVLHGRADAARPARRRAQVGRLHLGRPHVHAGQAESRRECRSSAPPCPMGLPAASFFGFNWVIGSRGVIDPDSPATRARDLRGRPRSDQSSADLTICKDADGRGCGERLQRLRVPDPGGRHGPTRRDGDRPGRGKARGTRVTRASTSRSPRRPPCRVPPPSRTSRRWHHRVTARPR